MIYIWNHNFEKLPNTCPLLNQNSFFLVEELLICTTIKWEYNKIKLKTSLFRLGERKCKFTEDSEKVFEELG